jgi:hypothetical protein
MLVKPWDKFTMYCGDISFISAFYMKLIKPHHNSSARNTIIPLLTGEGRVRGSKTKYCAV